MLGGCQTIPTVRMYIAHWGIFFAKKTFLIPIQTFWQKRPDYHQQKFIANINISPAHETKMNQSLPMVHL